MKLYCEDIVCSEAACFTPCSWAVRSQTEDLPWQPYSKVTSLDNVPHLFSGSTVLRYTAAEARWYAVGNLVHSRAQHTVVAVPEDWLCHGSFTTTTTTTTTSTASTAEVTTTSTVTSASPPPDCPEDVRCEATDGRGVFWSAEAGAWARRSCEGGAEAAWFCGCDGLFVGAEPDRSDCVDPWIRELEAMIADPAVSSDTIAEMIEDSLHDLAGPGPTGGGIRSLVTSCQQLLHKRQQEMDEDDDDNDDDDDDDDDDEDALDFTDNLVSSMSVLAGLEVGWNEIPEQERFESSSDMLTFVDSLGFQLSQERGARSRSRGCGGQEDSFEAAHLGLVVRRPGPGDSGDQCFSFDTAAVRGEVCLPGALLEAEPCPALVASQLLMDNQRSHLFPTSVEAAEARTSPAPDTGLSTNLIGLTVNNGSLPIDIPENSQNKIRITFIHKDPSVSSHDVDMTVKSCS